jgi:hypothetical protein
MKSVWGKEITTDITELKSPPIWLPTRILTVPDNDIQEQLDAVVKAASDSSTPAGSGVQPFLLLDCSATESPAKVQGRTVSEVSVSFTRDPADELFGGARIWFRGYQGSADPVLVAEGADSPITFQVESTGETVSVIAQAVSGGGVPADFDRSPTTTVTLDGVVSAPPAPNVSQVLVAIELGFQFSFDQLDLSSTEDVIQAYRVYRNTTNTDVGATLLRVISHDPTSTGAVVVQDQTAGGTFYCYFVSAVNTIGLESVKTAAQAAGTNANNVGTRSQVPINTAGTFTGSNPLTQDGTTTNILVGSFTMQWGFGTVSYNSGSVNPGSYGLWYVYADDPFYNGGATTYLATSSVLAVYQGEGRIYIGSITTAGGGGGTGGGGGGGCVEVGTPVEYTKGDEVQEVTEACSDWVCMHFPDWDEVRMHPDTLVKTWKKAKELQPGDRVGVGDGNWTTNWHAKTEHKPSFKIKRKCRPSQEYKAGSVRLNLHNNKPAP